MSTIFRRLDERRKRLGLSWNKVARATKLSATAFSKWKLGKQDPDLKSLIALCDFFNLSLDQVTGRASIPEGAARAYSLDEREEAVVLAYRQGTRQLRRIIDVVVEELVRGRGVDGISRAAEPERPYGKSPRPER